MTAIQYYFPGLLHFVRNDDDPVLFPGLLHSVRNDDDPVLFPGLLHFVRNDDEQCLHPVHGDDTRRTGVEIIQQI